MFRPAQLPLFEYVGNLHIHSSHSDGTGSVSEIAQAASRAGLDFIVFNDHDFMVEGLQLEEEGFYEGVLVAKGLEIGEASHHYLAYDLKEMIKARDSGPQDIIDNVNRQGGFGFLAHPFEKGMPFMDKSIAYTWNDLSVTGFAGICIWNFSSRWKERVITLWHGLLFLLFKSQLLKGPSRRTLVFWDRLCEKRRVVAIGGSDAHGVILKWGSIRFKPLTYDYLFTSINTHILLKKRLSRNFSEAKVEIYDAMKNGRLYLAHERLNSAKGFRFYYVSKAGDTLIMGEEGVSRPGHFYIEIPAKGEIRLIRNGKLQMKWSGKKVCFEVKMEGVYRVEVYIHLVVFGRRPWIFSNPIYLR